MKGQAVGGDVGRGGDVVVVRVGTVPPSGDEDGRRKSLARGNILLLRPMGAVLML